MRFGLGMVLAAAVAADAQVAPAPYENIAPAYEGWEQNPDGSFNLVFGYMNRNWDKALDVPIGPDNNIEPGGAGPGPADTFPAAAQPVPSSACRFPRTSATRKWCGP